jgi:hypothetical protein
MPLFGAIPKELAIVRTEQNRALEHRLVDFFFPVLFFLDFCSVRVLDFFHGLFLVMSTKTSIEASSAFLLLPDVRTRVRDNPDWSESQKVRLLTLINEWMTLNHQYRQLEYLMKISQ